MARRNTFFECHDCGFTERDMADPGECPKCDSKRYDYYKVRDIFTAKIEDLFDDPEEISDDD